MDNGIRKLSLASRGLKYKLKISFYLMSILPLLVSIYLISYYILPQSGLKLHIAASMLVSIFIALIGFFLIKGVFDRIVSVTSEARLIAAGDISRKLKVKDTDEVGDLSDALNQLTQRIRSNMDELKTYGEKTTIINMEIQKRVIMLSSLLQVSSLISQGARLDDILKITAEKARLLANSDASYLLFREEGQEDFYMKVADGINTGLLMEIKVGPREELFSKAISANKPLLLDQQNALTEQLTADFYKKFRLRNTLAMPIFLRGRVVAIFGIGSAREPFLYKREDVELLDIFAKQVAIAIENDMLMHRVEKLEIKDGLTGLYNAAFIHNRLGEEIKRAITCQRPCAFLLFDIDNFKKFYDKFGSLQSEAALKRIASLIKDSVTDIDRVGRIGDDEFAVVMPEKNKRKAQEIAEEVCKKIAFAFGEEENTQKRITVSGGVSENPLDGIDADSLITTARQAVTIAKREGRNRVKGI